MRGYNAPCDDGKLRFHISLAGVNIEIECQNRSIYNMCQDYMKEFNHPDFMVYTTRVELDEELDRDFAQIPEKELSYEGVATNRVYDGVESLVIERKIADRMPEYNSFLMHASVVALEGRAYMFTAASGVGKTTRTSLWLEEYPTSFVVNGDKPLLKVEEDAVLACGTPWCGKEGWNTNTMVPLRAIFLLERADEDFVEEISLGKAFPTILHQIHRPADPDAMRKTLGLLQALQGKVKFYRFRSTMNPEAVRMAYETAKP